MKRIVLLLCVLFICIAASVVSIVAYAGAKARAPKPSENVIERTITVADFDKLSADMVNVNVTIGKATGKARLTAPDNIIDDILVKVDEGELEVLYVHGKSVRRPQNIKATLYITVPYLREIEADQAAAVTLEGNMSVPGKLEISAETAAVVNGASITAATAKLEADTAAKIKLKSLEASEMASISAETAAAVKIDSLTTAHLSAEAETASRIAVAAGKANTCDLEAETASTINVAAMSIAGGKLRAATGSTIKSSVKSPVIKKDSGGAVSNKAD